ncbi:HEAT repeat domain-containing protein (plasmid) [Paraburkholderia sprentiae WSM5005]|uniref:HEAT repeat domain-containing protein n=1 Tax=Paraburkholderia sprentiae WSM5005 TaxID=754502 RepID=A0A1I9YU38_9BURK|nr:HEAT repeat domain-containing protein [Paraburkholderia sprentiae]APA89731.1 HEAT repeat domain-containing protein [Paraburkholderia sprentiae WSM5005]
MTVFAPPVPNAHDLTDEASALLARLADADAAVRRIALFELADLEDAALLPAFVAALSDDPAPEVRREAACVLGAWESDEVVQALCVALLDADAEVREAAAQSLSAMKEPASGHVLSRWADRPEPFVRRAVLRGLRELRFAQALDPALRALTDPDADVRLEAVAVLGWLKDARALALLASIAANDASAEVRRAAVGALGFASADDRAIVDALLAALRDSTWQVREEAATTLGKLRAAAARAALVEALDDAYWQVRLRAARALGQLRDAQAAAPVAALLSQAISNLRKEAALALGELGSRGSLPALQAALDDRDPEVRKAVRIAIAQIEGGAR